MLLKRIFFRSLMMIISFIVVACPGSVFADDVNCPTNSTYNGSECVCNSGYTKTSNEYDFNVKNPTYSYSGATFTAEATNIGTIYGESLGWEKGTGSIESSTPAGTYTGKNCWCRIVAPFETNWTYSGGAVAPSSTIPEGSEIWFDKCSERCANKTYSTTIRSFYGNNILNNGEVCIANASASCSDGYYWDENDQECKYDYEAACTNLGELYYWENGECKNHDTDCENYSGNNSYWNGEYCDYKDNQYCIQRHGNNYYWNRDTEQCESVSDLCPAFSETVITGPWIETPGQWFDFNGDGQRTIDECIVMRGYANYGHHSQSVVDYPIYRMYVNFADLIGHGDIDNALNINTIGTGVVCRYNPNTHNYDYACTNGINLCDNEEIMEMMQVAGYNSVDLLRYFIGLYEDYSNMSIPESDYKNLFTQSSENTELVDRCSVIDAVCPEHSQTFANGPVAEMVGYGVDFNDDGNITLDECIAGRVYSNIGDLFMGENTNNVIFERFSNFYTLRDLALAQQTYDSDLGINNKILNVAFCKYNSETGNYDNGCTSALSAFCSETDLYGINGTNFQTRTMFPYMIEKAQESIGMTIPKTSYSMLFTNSSENISTQDICPTCQFGYDDPPFCDMTEYTYCNSGEYLYVDFDNEFYECRQCEPNSYCPYSQDYEVLSGTQGIESCPEGAMSEPGAVDESACFCADDDYMTAEGCVTKDNEYCELEYGPYYYWDGETCSEKDDTYCELEYGQYYYWDTSSQTCRYNYEAECEARGADYIWNNEKQECETTEFICSSDKYLRIGDNESDKMCLSENQATHPALAVGVAGNVYYIPLSYTDSYINENSRKKMKILYNGNIYNAHDGSVE